MNTSTFFEGLVHEDRVHRSIYTDAAIFEREMTHVFGAVWVYLAHESQIPKPDDFITARLGLRPLIVVRDSKGKIRALYNRCTHRGARVCRQERGNARTFQCAYHGWTYFNTGKLRGVPWPEGYACDFKDAQFNLAQVPRVESYRGFVFGTLNLDAPSLENYLGGVRKPIDEWIDRHPGGKVEVREANRLKYKGNWKLAYDNAADGYHVAFSHRSLLEMENRMQADPTKGMSFYLGKPDEAPMYVQVFAHGHHFKDKRPNVDKRPGALWEKEAPHPGMQFFADRIRDRLGGNAPTCRSSATTSRCSSRSPWTRPMPPGTPRWWSTRRTSSAARWTT
jgi:phenylpropionate dioxygenase-like ring-hydroxylating dioxygenase large terminal subunit